jgi:hypothetical protein
MSIPSTTPFCDAFLDIVFLSAKTKMSRINTSGIVARMKHTSIERIISSFNRAIVDFVGNTMRSVLHGVPLKYAIAGFQLRPGPQPALRKWARRAMQPERFNQRLAKGISTAMPINKPNGLPRNPSLLSTTLPGKRRGQSATALTQTAWIDGWECDTLGHVKVSFQTLTKPGLLAQRPAPY